MRRGSRLSPRVFERFTDKARQAVVLAQEEAQTLKHNYLGTEHLLLGLLRDDGVAGNALASFDITLDETRDAVKQIVGVGDEVVTGRIPFTPRAKKVLELGMREAQALDNDYIGTEHLLLGIARDNVGRRSAHLARLRRRPGSDLRAGRAAPLAPDLARPRPAGHLCGLPSNERSQPGGDAGVRRRV